MKSRDIDRELALARQSLTPSVALRERVRNGLVASSAATRGASALLLAELLRSQSPWQALRSSGRLGSMVGAGLLAIGAGSGYWLRAAGDEPPPLPRAPLIATAEEAPLEPEPLTLSREAVPAEEAPRAGGVGAARSAPASGPATRTRRPRPRSSDDTSTPDAVAPAAANDEMALLQRAERAVRSHHPALALALTSELDERYPRSQLLEERRAIVLLARCTSGEPGVGAEAARFVRTYPKSVYASRIRELCLDGPGGGASSSGASSSSALSSGASSSGRPRSDDPGSNESISSEHNAP